MNNDSQTLLQIEETLSEGFLYDFADVWSVENPNLMDETCFSTVYVNGYETRKNPKPTQRFQVRMHFIAS